MKKLFFILIITLSAFSLLQPSAIFARESIFSEDFDDNYNEWPIEDDEYTRTSIANGTFIFEHKMDEGGYHVYYPVYIDTDKNFEIEITLSQISGHDDRGYGLIWGMEDSNNYYTFNITDNGYYRVSKIEYGEWYDIIDWTESEYINTYRGKNTLLLKKVGNLYNFYINGSYVNMIEFQPFFGNDLGFTVWLRQRIAIDNIYVHYIDTENAIIDEDFSDNYLNWIEDSDDEMIAEVRDGYYLFEHKREEGSYFLWNYVDIVPEYDFEISTTITHSSGVHDYGYGITWGMEDVDNLYCFNISDNGYYRYGKYVDDEWTNLIDWTESDVLRSNNATNTLTIRKSNDQYNFFINGEWVDSYRFESFFGGYIGFVIFRNQFIKIHDLVVRQEVVGKKTILDQAEQLLSDITVTYPGYDESYRTIANGYWTEAELIEDSEERNALALLYLKSAKAEISSADPRLTALADALAHAGYALNSADGTDDEKRKNYEKAFECFSITLQIDEMLGNEDLFVNSYINIGATYHKRGYYAEAINNYTKALNHAKDMNDHEGVLSAYNHLGWASEDNEKYYIAIDYYTLGIEYAQKVDNEDQERFFNYIIAEIYDYELEDWEEAIVYYERALTIARQQGDMVNVKSYLGYIGDCYYYLYDEEMAVHYYGEADAIIIEE